ncbi:NADP-dependent oxidoreductase [Streptomyces sp. NPDC096176]|uniref:NADP-dependent oxidoreductase n=1 Tax=Streptomyces sp. NPDC096176 TaxID=3366079 RepID=UPI0037FCB7E9
MRAVAVREFGAEPELIQVPKPEPEQGEVVVKIEYASLNPLDWQIADGALLSGGPGRVPPPDSPQTFPLVLGADFAGKVDVVGPGDNRFRVGDAVFGRTSGPPAGSYAEYVSVPHDGPVAFVPDGLALRDAALLPTAGTAAAQLLDLTGVGAGDSLLVLGAAGGVGCLLTQLAAARGVRVVAVVRGDERRRMSGLGAALTVDATVEDPAGAVRRVCPDGVDAVADLVTGTPESFAVHAGLGRPGAVAVATRFDAGATPLAGGVAGVGFRLRPSTTLLDTLAAAAADGSLHAPVDAELPLEKAPDALVQNRAGGARGKTVFAL